MEPRTITPADWALLLEKVKAGLLPISKNTLRAIRYGSRRWTDDLAVAAHAATDGAVPCWVLRPDHFREGVIPPCLDHSAPPLDEAV